MKLLCRKDKEVVGGVILKNTIKYMIFIISLFLISGCSNSEQLELIENSVSIEVREGEMEINGESLSGVYLKYDFSIKNSGRKTVGGMEEPNPDTYNFDDGLQYVIEPSDELVNRSIEILGYNIFEDIGKTASSLTPLLKSNEISEDNYIGYFLGVQEQTELQPVAPSKEQLDLLIEVANDAVLILSVKDKEIARLNLSE